MNEVKFVETEQLVIRKIGESAHYDLVVAYHIELGFPTYALVNREYNVIEIWVSNLPTARQTMEQFEELLETEGNAIRELEALSTDTPN